MASSLELVGKTAPPHGLSDLGTLDSRAVIWLLCHYPDTEEAEERVRAACALYHALDSPIWLFGTASARYPASVERLLKEKLVAAGVPSEKVVCSSDRREGSSSLDTVQEAHNVAAAAVRDGITGLVCVSNRLQLLQVRGLLRSTSLRLVFAPTRLRDWRWWYVVGRLLLIPLAYLGIGHRFPPLVLVRRARAKLAAWPF